MQLICIVRGSVGIGHERVCVRNPEAPEGPFCAIALGSPVLFLLVNTIASLHMSERKIVHFSPDILFAI